MRVLSAVGKSERIKAHQHSFYAPNLKEHVMLQWGSMDKVRIPKTRPSEPSHRNQVPAFHSQYLPNTIRALNYKTNALPYHCGSTLPSVNRPRHRKRSSYGGLATYSAIL
ncbi:hypothetical protein M9H77_17234 [Catharanthus roseus]|uniref:Uncharacterized protein n=1 Tax=Catharanthus roseus TaxID=4058 RepID=A0ACC0B3Z3_CATRO|nr:hypothetical protein M9H77_17234 [Catharanthus roseus]